MHYKCMRNIAQVFFKIQFAKHHIANLYANIEGQKAQEKTPPSNRARRKVGAEKERDFYSTPRSFPRRVASKTHR